MVYVIKLYQYCSRAIYCVHRNFSEDGSLH